MKKRFTEEQIVKMIQEHKEGKTVPEISREYGIEEQTFYKWQQKYGNMKVSLNNYLVWNNFVNYARESYKEKEQILTDSVFTTEKKVL